MTDADQLALADTERLLARLGDLAGDLVLIGGQAVNFWAEYYASRVPELAREAPFTSRDIDFCGTRKLVKRCALRLGGTPHVTSFDDHGASQAGTVVYLDENGTTRVLDVMNAPHGLDARDVAETSIEADILDHGAPMGLKFLVMHPERCFESRVHNEGLSAKRGRPLPLKQLRASIHCAREFTRDVLHVAPLDGRVRVRTALKLNERIARFCTYNKHARALYQLYGIDPSDAILLDDALPEAFRTVRYPQIKARLIARRISDGL